MENGGNETVDSGFGINKDNEKQIDTIIEDQDFKRKQKRAQTCTGFEEADWVKALQQRKSESNCFYKGKEVQTPVSLPFFKSYGSGIFLFFSFAWQISVLFLFFTIISIIPITINYLKGSAFSNSESSLQFYITKASIGNYQYENQTLTYQQSINYKIANVVIDIFMALCFMIFCLYWEHKSQKLVKQINLSIKLLSANTLEVNKFPEGVKQNDIQQFMSKFGDVVQVAAVKNYSNQIQLSKQIYDKRLEIKQIQIDLQPGQQSNNNQKIQKLKKQSEQLQKQLQNHEVAKQEYIKFYVQFEKPEIRDAILQKFKPYQRLCLCCMDPPSQDMLLKDFLINVTPCENQPTGIIWQNVHVTWRTRWLRLLIQGIIILTVIASGFLLISFLNVLLPPSQKNIDTSSYTWTAIQTLTNKTIVQDWCNKHIQFSSSSQYYTYCFSYWKSYVLAIVIKIGISVVIVVLKAIIKIIMVFIAKFQKYSTHTQQSVAIMTNLLITYLSTTVLITFLMQANVFSISFKSIIKGFITDPTLLNNLSQIAEYYDLGSPWYRDIGYQIWFNVFTLSFIPHIFMPLVLHLMQCISIIRGKGEKLYRKMYQKIQPAQFQIQDNYANLLMIVLIGFVFGGGSPCMIIVSFIGLITRYIYYKYIFVRFCRIPKTYNQSLNNRAISILKIVLLIRCLISLYMYGADGIFAMQKNAFMKWSQSLQLPLFSSIFIVISRVFLTWYYSIFVLFFIAALIFKELIINNIIKLCKKSQQVSKLEQSNIQFQQKCDQIISQRALTKSYRLENNPDYIQILAIMKMKNRKKSAQRQSISPMPMMSNVQPAP